MAHIKDLIYYLSSEMVFYFAPSPGAAGIAEISAAGVMGGIVPPECMGAYVLLWRLFTLLIGLGAGALVMVRSLYRARRESQAL